MNAGILQRLEQLEVQAAPKVTRTGYDSYPRGDSSQLTSEGGLGRAEGRLLGDQVKDLYITWNRRKTPSFNLQVGTSMLKVASLGWGGEVPCRRFVWWPHDLCFLGPDCKRVVYDELTPLQWCCGFIRTILKTSFHATRHNMLVYVSELLQNALDLVWHTARGSYKVLMTEIEAQTLDWDYLEGVQGIRRQYAQRNVNRPL